MAAASAEQLNAAAEEARALPFDTLEDAYQRGLIATGQKAARRFAEIVSLTAAADWTPPALADVLNVTVNTRRIRGAQTALMERVAGTISQVPGIDFGVTHQMSQEILNTLGQRAIPLGEHLRGPVAAAIAKGWAEGLSVPDTADRIRAATRGVAPFRATMLARTDLIGMSNGGAQLGAEMLNEASAEVGDTKPIKSRTWQSSEDGRVRPSHQEANGQTVPFDQPYTVGGAKLRYPGDPSGPSDEVVQCRCVELFNSTAAPGEKPPPSPGISGRSQLANDLLGDAKDTQARYLTAQGTYTPTREALHRQIIHEFLEEAESQQNPSALYMAGGSGAGKSTVMKSLAEKGGVPRKAVHIDPDAIKERLPEYRALIEAKDEAAARLVHEESGDIAARLLQASIDRKFNVVVDGTGNSDVGKFLGKLERQREAGYDVDVVVVDIPTDEAVARAAARAERTGRKVPEEVIRQIHRDVAARFNEWADSGAVRSWQVWANEGRPPVLIARRTGVGEATDIRDSKRWDQFLRKADESVEKPNVKVSDTFRIPRMFHHDPVVDEAREAFRKLEGNLAQWQLDKLEHLEGGQLPIRVSPGLIDGQSAGQHSSGVISVGGVETQVSGGIRISMSGPTPGNTVLHELGHYLDVSFLGRRIYGSHEWAEGGGGTWPEMEAFFDAVLKSRKFKVLDAIGKRYQRMLQGDGLDTSNPANVELVEHHAKHVEYMMRPQELWARAFAQWMTERFGGPLLKAELRARMTLERENETFPSQWEEEDFRELSDAIEEVLRSRGLLGPLKQLAVTAALILEGALAAIERGDPLASLLHVQAVQQREAFRDLLVGHAFRAKGQHVQGDQAHSQHRTATLEEDG